MQAQDCEWDSMLSTVSGPSSDNPLKCFRFQFLTFCPPFLFLLGLWWSSLGIWLSEEAVLPQTYSSLKACPLVKRPSTRHSSFPIVLLATELSLWAFWVYSRSKPWQEAIWFGWGHKGGALKVGVAPLPGGQSRKGNLSYDCKPYHKTYITLLIFQLWPSLDPTSKPTQACLLLKVNNRFNTLFWTQTSKP